MAVFLIWLHLMVYGEFMWRGDLSGVLRYKQYKGFH
jgi:hypothetical protein